MGEEQWVSAGEFDGTGVTIEWVEYMVRVAVFNIHGEAVAGSGRATPTAG